MNEVRLYSFPIHSINSPEHWLSAYDGLILNNRSNIMGKGQKSNKEKKKPKKEKPQASAK